MYISEKLRDQARLTRFREALSGAHKEFGPDETLRDFGVNQPVEQDDIADLGHVYGPQLHKDNLEEESVVTGLPVSEEDFAQKQPTMLARMLSGGRSGRASQAETVMSRTSSSISYETPDYPHKETQVSRDFHDRAMSLANNANPDMRDVNAVQMVMENIFDWDFHERHHGDTLTREVLSVLVNTLKKNLKATCPSVSSAEVMDLFSDLVENRWLGDITNIREVTRGVVAALLDAQNGNSKPLEKVERIFRGSVRFHERFYAGLGQDSKIPLRTLAAALERQGGRPAAGLKI